MTDPKSAIDIGLAGRYRIERNLGAGGMATVFLAQDLRHNRKVAIKVLRPDLAALLGGDRFLKEIEATANLQHPHILGLIESGSVDGHLFYVMPFIAGESLRARLTFEHAASRQHSRLTGSILHGGAWTAAFASRPCRRLARSSQSQNVANNPCGRPTGNG